MKSIFYFISLGLTFAFLSCQGKDPMTQNKSESSQVMNEVCPISGEKVNENAKTVVYDGKTYGFCCNGCDVKFQKEPVKYIANLTPDGKKFIGKPEEMH